MVNYKEKQENDGMMIALAVEGEECTCGRTHRRCCKTLVRFYFRWWGHRYYFLFLFKLNIHIIYPLLYAYLPQKVKKYKSEPEVR